MKTHPCIDQDTMYVNVKGNRASKILRNRFDFLFVYSIID